MSTIDSSTIFLKKIIRESNQNIDKTAKLINNKKNRILHDDKEKTFQISSQTQQYWHKTRRINIRFAIREKAQEIINNLWNHCLSNRTIKFLTVSLPSLDFNFSIAGRNEEEEKPFYYRFNHDSGKI